ncbi:MAG: TetR/AcrR family transcriptional regulator [Anaerolineaceae bacterium]
MPRKDDRRIQRTRKLLRESMLALILEQGYDDINIQDVTDRANLGRATFYLHYKEKDDLLADVMRQMFDDFLASAPQILNNQWNLHDIRGVQKMFEFAEQHYDLYRIMMIGKGSVIGSKQVHTILQENISASLGLELERLNAETIISRVFIENYYTGALLSLIYWWLDNEMPYSPTEMAVMFQQINGLGRAELLRPKVIPDLVETISEDKNKQNTLKNRQPKPADKKTKTKPEPTLEPSIKADPATPGIPKEAENK